MDQYRQLSCGAFSEALFSKAPVPGGGAAAAYIGALSAALCAMAGNLTVGKRKYAAVEGELRQMIGRAEALRLRFLELMDEDAAAFEPLSRAYALPKSEPKSAEILRMATLDAICPPYEMMRCVCRAIDLLEEMRHRCSRLLLSDVGCGAAAARAALEAAALNVLVNTASLPGDARAEALQTSAEIMLANYSDRAQRLADDVRAALKEGANG